MSDDRLKQAMLLDFYGELLTEKQRECYDLHYNEDLSLAEIAEQSGISRQGVWDNIRRAELTMNDIEEKTGLIARFQTLEAVIAEAESAFRRIEEMTDGPAKTLARKMAQRLDSKVSGD